MDLRSTSSRLFRTPADLGSFVWSWLLGFALIVYLGLSGGGFDLLVSGQVGIAIWWTLLLGMAIGALPRERPSRTALVLLGIFGGFCLWTALSLRWTESTEKTAIDVARVATLLGVFALALLSRGRESAARMTEAMAAGIAVIAVIAVLSRLHPSWFPDSLETARFLDTAKERLSYPLDYWNGLAALIGIGLPLLLRLTCAHRSNVVRVLATAVLPMVLLALFMTLSRGGIAASLIALALFIAFTSNRIPQFLVLVLVLAAAAIPIAVAAPADELMNSVAGPAARSQGWEVFWVMIGVSVAASLIRAAALAAGKGRPRPSWTKVSRRTSLIACGSAVLVVIVALVAVNAPSRLSSAWDDFKRPSGQAERGTQRLTSVGGENRYELFTSALREFDEDPLKGTGAATFQLWWTRDGEVSEPIVDTHSLYLQALGELGIVGFALIVTFALGALGVGARAVVRAGPNRPVLAAALAGSTVIWSTSIFDWGWKIPILPIATLLLIAVLATAGQRSQSPKTADATSERQRGGLPIPARAGGVTVAVLALIAIAIPLAGATMLRDSQEHARAGDLDAALADARSAQNVQPGAAAPRMQEALLFEQEGALEQAAEAADAATEREPTNWRTWLLLSRIEAQRGRPAAALAAYREARSLNPLSPILDPP